MLISQQVRRIDELERQVDMLEALLHGRRRKEQAANTLPEEQTDTAADKSRIQTGNSSSLSVSNQCRETTGNIRYLPNTHAKIGIAIIGMAIHGNKQVIGEAVHGAGIQRART